MLRMYEQSSAFLRVEVLSNHLPDFRLKKSLQHLGSGAANLPAGSSPTAAGLSLAAQAALSHLRSLVPQHDGWIQTSTAACRNQSGRKARRGQ